MYPEQCYDITNIKVNHKGVVLVMKNNMPILKLAQTALLAALCYVAFAYLKIPIPLPGGDAVALHIGNAFCVLAALLLGGVYGGLAGSIGMTIADLMDPMYLSSAPKTFVLKFCIGLITGIVAHKIAKITETEDKRYIFKWTLLSSIGGLGFNVVFDPIVGYFYKLYILGVNAELSAVLAKWAAGATFINAVVSVILVVFLYMALRPTLKKAGIFPVPGVGK